MRSTSIRCFTLCAALFLALTALASSALADVGLITEGAVGRSGFFSDVGHSSVWISRACIDHRGDLYFCEHTPGVVLSGADYWLKTGAAAIPAYDYFLGPEGSPDADEQAAWRNTLGSTYPRVSAEFGAKYLGRAWDRQIRVQVFPTTIEQDKLAIVRAQGLRDRYRYRLLRENCANFSLSVLRFWLGSGLTIRHWSEANIVTPVAVEHGLFTALGRAPQGELVTYRFPPPPGLRQRRPARDICSALLYDPKYAAAVFVASPFAYAGVASCYGWTHLRDHLRSLHTTTLPMPLLVSIEDQKTWTPEQVFAAMTHSDDERIAAMPAAAASSAPPSSSPPSSAQPAASQPTVAAVDQP